MDHAALYLILFEMEINGLVRRGIRPDGEEGWEPIEGVPPHVLDEFFGAGGDEDDLEDL